MSIFEYLQTCSIEEFAEWLVVFHNEAEEGILEKLESSGYTFTKIRFDPAIQVERMVKDLETEIA